MLADKKRTRTLTASSTNREIFVADTDVARGTTAATPHRGARRHAHKALILMVIAGAQMMVVLGGRMGDILGRRRMFITGLALFTIGSFLAGVAPSFGLLPAGRAVQGV